MLTGQDEPDPEYLIDLANTTRQNINIEIDSVRCNRLENQHANRSDQALSVALRLTPRAIRGGVRIP